MSKTKQLKCLLSVGQISIYFGICNSFRQITPPYLHNQYCLSITLQFKINTEHTYPLGYRIKFHLPFNNIKWLSDYSRRWQVKGYSLLTQKFFFFFTRSVCPIAYSFVRLATHHIVVMNKGNHKSGVQNNCYCTSEPVTIIINLPNFPCKNSTMHCILEPFPC